MKRNAAQDGNGSSSDEEDIRAVDWWRTRSQETQQSSAGGGTTNKSHNNLAIPITPDRSTGTRSSGTQQPLQLSPDAGYSWAHGRTSSSSSSLSVGQFKTTTKDQAHKTKRPTTKMATTESIEVDELSTVQEDSDWRRQEQHEQHQTINDLLPINMSPLRASSLPFERTRTEGSSLATSDEESDLGFKILEHEEQESVNQVGVPKKHDFRTRTRTDAATMQEYVQAADTNSSFDLDRDELDNIVLGVNHYNMMMAQHRSGETRTTTKNNNNRQQTAQDDNAETNRVAHLLTLRNRGNKDTRPTKSSANVGPQHPHDPVPVVSPPPNREPSSPKRSPTPQEAAAASAAAASHIRSGASPRYHLQQTQQKVPVVTPPAYNNSSFRDGFPDEEGRVGGVDSLSNVPSNVDVETRERYLLACRLLKATMIEKDSRLLPEDKEFLRDLLEDAENATAPSDFDIAKIETASDLLSDSEDEILYPQQPRRFRVSSIKEAWQKKAQELLSTRLPSISMSPDGAAASASRSSSSTTRTTLQPKSLNPTRTSPFIVLGKRPDAAPGVFTQPLMEALRGFLSDAKSQENFWLRYKLNPHPANGEDSLQYLLHQVKNCSHTFIGVETKDGHVFGAYCSSPWKIQRAWFGSKDSFLWRLKKSRLAGGGQHPIYDFDNEMEVYPYTGHDEQIQYCTERTLAVGGGQWNLSNAAADSNPHPDEPPGIGFMLDEDLMGGETNSCATFANPSLSGKDTGNEFDVVHLEVYTLTPCLTVSEALRLEEKRAAIAQNARTF
jgi:hypothetical protein